MKLSKDTFSGAGGAVSDLFAGFSALAKGDMAAKGLNIQASGTRLSAESTRLSASSLRIKAQGDLAESDNYDRAAELARTNEAYTAESTRLQQYQLDRQVTQTIGGQRASVAGAGLSSGGSAGDLLRDSASQGAIANAVLGQQNLITQAGFEEQAKSFDTMSAAGRAAATAEYGIATKTDAIAGRQDDIANQQDQLAVDTKKASRLEATGDFVSSVFKGAAAAATLFA